MGLQIVPAYIGAAGYQHPVELDRNILEAVFGRTGAVRSGDFAVTPTGVAHQFTIGAGAAFLLGTENATQGGYFAWSDASSTHVLAAPSGQPRYDTLVLRVKDSQYGTISGTPEAYWDIIQGTPNASPVPIADSTFAAAQPNYVPGAWWRVANILRGTSDTTIPGGNVTTFPRYVRNTRNAYLAASTDTISDQRIGDNRFNSNTGVEQLYDGAAWMNSGTWRKVQTLLVDTPSVSFDIPSSIRHVRVMWTARGAVASPNVSIQARVNNIFTTSYAYHWVVNSNSATTAGGYQASGDTWATLGVMPAASSTAGRWSVGSIDLPAWDSPHAGLNALFTTSYMDPGYFNAYYSGGFFLAAAGPWVNLQIMPASGNLLAGSQFIVEGLA